MREELLHYVWRLQRYDATSLHTTEGLPLVIHSHGEYNTFNGPDFTSARIDIGGTHWAGAIEIHVKSSDWKAHKHQEDEAYENVVLHVVYEEDVPIYREDGERIPCLELQHRIPEGLEGKYYQLLQETYWIPCEHQLEEIGPLTLTNWLERMALERLDQKSVHISAILERNTQDWEESFFQVLARSYGQQANGDAMELLARITPLKLLQKHRNSLPEVEALLLGQAGFLKGTFEDKYSRKLKSHYEHLKNKYQLLPMPVKAWKTAGIRPGNFPMIRIAQLARLVVQTEHLFSKALAIREWKDLQGLFELSAGHYWDSHYRLDHQANVEAHPKRPGAEALMIIGINAVAPMIYLYGKVYGSSEAGIRAMALLESIPAESNKVIKQWKSKGIPAINAGQSQGLLQLKKYYCDAKKCLQCAIGHQLLKDPSGVVEEPVVIYLIPAA